MCWNAEVSLSTFVLSSAAIAIALITNGRADAGFAVFYFSIASMQLLEFFIWRWGLRRPGGALNRALSVVGLGIVLAQPLAAALIIEGRRERAWYLAAYAAWLVVYFATSWRATVFRTGVADNGHLRWDWFRPASGALVATWVAFVIAAMWLSRMGRLTFVACACIAAGFAAYTYFAYGGGGAWGSVYCSLVNVVFAGIIVKAFASHYCAAGPLR